MGTLTVITPFLNEDSNLLLFRQRLVNVLDQIDMPAEIIMVDDHSLDRGPEVVKDWLRTDSRVRYIRLSRTCGSHAANSAGLEKARGDCAILLAADLQDPPETIPALLEEWRKGNDVVWAVRAERQQEAWHTKFLSRSYYWLLRMIALPDMQATGADFLLMGRKVIDAYNKMPEKNTSLLCLVLWMGFRQCSIEYVKRPRHSGSSKWNVTKKLKLFVDSMVSFSYAPIRFMSALGCVVSLSGLLYAMVILANRLAGRLIEGWASLMVVVLVLGGFQLLFLGILGEYLWRAFDQARGRPRFIIEEYVDSSVAVPRDRNVA